ncbi:MAG: hypothetical protein SGCHY_001838 [Lobulomycetales sp.]
MNGLNLAHVREMEAESAKIIQNVNRMVVSSGYIPESSLAVVENDATVYREGPSVLELKNKSEDFGVDFSNTGVNPENENSPLHDAFIKASGAHALPCSLVILAVVLAIQLYPKVPLTKMGRFDEEPEADWDEDPALIARIREEIAERDAKEQVKKEAKALKKASKEAAKNLAAPGGKRGSVSSFASSASGASSISSLKRGIFGVLKNSRSSMLEE